jgi:F420H(2)-dependent quinone reductase
MRSWIRRKLVRFWSRTMSQWHVRLYRATRGKVGARRLRNQILLLETAGRRSGRPHTVPLVYARLGDEFLVAAGNVAFRWIPHWLQNVRCNEHVRVTLRGEVVSMSAREADPSERDRLWETFTCHVRGFEAVQRRSDQPIPVVVVSPVRSRTES